MIAGHRLAGIEASVERIDPQMAPLPSVDFDGLALTINLAPEAAGNIRPTEDAAPATSVVDEATAVIQLAAVKGLPAPLVAVLTGAEPDGRPVEAPPALTDAIERVTGMPVDSIQLIIDVLMAPGGAMVDEPLVQARTILFGPGGYAPDSAAGFELLVRAIGAALVGVDGPVPSVATEPSAESIAGTTTGEAGGGLAPGASPRTTGGETAPGPIDRARTEAAAQVPDGGPPLGDQPSGDAAAETGSEGEQTGTGEEPPVAPYELQIPPAPSEPGPGQSEGLSQVRSRTGRAGAAARDVPSAEVATDAARQAVQIPDAETLGRAQQVVAATLEQQITPSPEIIELCQGIGRAIREHRPVDEDELLDADLREPAEQAGASLNESVEVEGDAVGQNYTAVDGPPPLEQPPGPQPIDEVSSSIGSPDLATDAAQPDEVPPEDLSLANDEAEVQRRVDDSEIHRPTTEVIPDGPFAAARDAQAELGDLAETGPSQVAEQQQQAIAASQEEMAVLQMNALEALNRARATTVTSAGGRQGSMVETEGQTRDRLAGEANRIFESARTDVTNQLTPLTGTAMGMWQADLAVLTTDFRSSLDRVKAWVDDRHSGIGGSIVAVWDSVTGLPGWVTREYDRAEREFTDGVCTSLTRISIHVNTVIAAVEGIIAAAEAQIRTLFTENLPAGLESWAAGQLQGFQQQLDGLREDVDQTRTAFLGEISREAISAVQTVQTEIETLREEAKGIIDKVVDAIEEFVDDPITAIINGLLRLVGIPPPAFWSLVEKISQVIEDIANDPIGFINNLVSAVKAGFEGFFERFPTHVIEGFWDWLFSGLEGGVAKPEDFGLESLVTFALELMGLNWANIREILVRHVGEENVELIEQAWELLSTLITQGIDGVLELVAERLNPATILQQIISAAIDYLMTTLIALVVEKVVLLLNPVGIIAQAIMLIWEVLTWIFNNAARIFRFVETIVNGIADIVAGNIGAMAQAVELALASLIPVVIDFLAGLLRLDGLPDAVAEVIVGLREFVLGAVDAAVGFIVTQARALLEALGIGGDDDEADADAEVDDGDVDTELGTEVRFSAEGESHRHWIDNTGTEAVLMVASRPGTVVAKLDEWETRLDELDDETKASTQALLAQARQLHDSADGAADVLAEVYAAAAVAPADDENAQDPPSDQAVESTQRDLANVLDRLFTIFDGDKDLVVRFEQRLAAMHPDGRQDAIADIGGLSDDEAAEMTSWDTLVVRLKSSGKVGLAHETPTHVGSSAFQAAAAEKTLAALASIPAAADWDDERRRSWLQSRKQHLRASSPGDGYGAMVRALSDWLWGDRDPTGALVSGFTNLLGDEPDNDLVEAMRIGLIQFLDQLGKGATFGAITKANFQQTWDKPPNRDLIKDAFRALSRGSHEWIPTNFIPNVLARTSTAQDAQELDDWIQMHDEMRTDTDWIIFKPSYATGTAIIEGENQSALSGHVGAVYYPERGAAGGERRQLTTNQGPWHDRLRAVFLAEQTPSAVVSGMKDVAEATVWGGGGGSNLTYRSPYYQKSNQGPYTFEQLGDIAGGNLAGLAAQFDEWARRFND